MPKTLIIIFTALVIGTWFLISDKSTFKEKVELVFFIAFIYVLCMVGLGAESLNEIVGPLTKLFSR